MALEALTPLTEAEAVEALRLHQVPDPTGQSTPESLAAAGQAFGLKAEGGSGTFVLVKKGAQIWIEAGAGRAADDLTELGLELIEEIARRSECSEVAFQTARRGLVKKSELAGYQVVGWIMKKKVFP